MSILLSEPLFSHLYSEHVARLSYSDCMKHTTPQLVQVQPSLNNKRREARGTLCRPAHSRSCDDVDRASRVGVGHLSAAVKYLEKGTRERGESDQTRPDQRV